MSRVSPLWLQVSRKRAVVKLCTSERSASAQTSVMAESADISGMGLSGRNGCLCLNHSWSVFAVPQMENPHLAFIQIWSHEYIQLLVKAETSSLRVEHRPPHWWSRPPRTMSAPGRAVDRSMAFARSPGPNSTARDSCPQPRYADDEAWDRSQMHRHCGNGTSCSRSCCLGMSSLINISTECLQTVIAWRAILPKLTFFCGGHFSILLSSFVIVPSGGGKQPETMFASSWSSGIFTSLAKRATRASRKPLRIRTSFLRRSEFSTIKGPHPLRILNDFEWGLADKYIQILPLSVAWPPETENRLRINSITAT